MASSQHMCTRNKEEASVQRLIVDYPGLVHWSQGRLSHRGLPENRARLTFSVRGVCGTKVVFVANKDIE